jgi:hypothetical protein
MENIIRVEYCLMMTKLWGWLPFWGKVLLVLASLAILALLVYYVAKHIFLIVALIIVVMVVLYEFGWLTTKNLGKAWQIAGALANRLGSGDSKAEHTESPEDRSPNTTMSNETSPSRFPESNGDAFTDQREAKPHNAPQDDLQFRQKFPAQHRATDGHHVRSKSELVIDNWLYTYRNRISHVYESKLPIPEALYCDFCIEQGDKKKVYIEYWGYESDPRYLARKRNKVEIYEKYGFQLIQLNNKEISTLDDVLPRKLREYGIELE